LLSDYFRDLVAVNTKPRPKPPEGLNGGYETGMVENFLEARIRKQIFPSISFMKKAFFQFRKIGGSKIKQL